MPDFWDNIQDGVEENSNFDFDNVDIDTDKYSNWINKNLWVIGIVYIIVGPIFALFGAQLFPYIGASIVAMFVIVSLSTIALAFGWMNVTWAMVVCIICAIALGVLAGCIVRRNMWALVGLMGLVGGWFGGVVLFSAINAASGWDAVWGYWVISIVCGAIGCWAACHFGKFVVMLSTSGVGSYLFMRSWTLFFPGHYPSESDMMDGGDSMDYDGIFWLFIGVFAVSWVGSYIFQAKFTHYHEELEEWEKH